MYEQWRIQKLGIWGAEGSEDGAMPPSQKTFENLMQKIMHFGAKFSYIFRCIRSIGRAAAPAPF